MNDRSKVLPDESAAWRTRLSALQGIPAGSEGARKAFLPTSTWSLLLAVLAGSLMAPVTRLYAAEPGPAQPATVVSDEHVLWIVASDWDQDQEQQLNWLVWMEPASLVQNALHLPAQLGQVRSSAVVDGRLHLFFLNAKNETMKTAHYAYSRNGNARRQLRLPSDALPMALAGDSSTLWAMVDGGTAQKISTAWRDAQRSHSTQPAEDPVSSKDAKERNPESTVASRPDELPKDRCFLVKYDGSNWQPGCEAPPDLPVDAQTWIVLDGSRQHLLWCGPAGSSDVHYVRREAERWTEGPVLSFAQRVTSGYAGFLNKQFVFAALITEPSGAGLQCEPRVLAPAGDTWDHRPLLQTADKQPLRLPKGTLVGGTADKLVLLTPSAKGVHVGLWSPSDGQVIQGFTEVPIRKSPTELDPADHTRDLVPLVVVMVVIMLVYWARRTSLGIPVLVAPGPTAATLDRRALAALLDLAPALIVVLVFWWKPIVTYYAEMRAAEASPEVQPWPSLQPVLIPWFVCIGSYAVYCTVFELLWSMTPGKRLLGCAVVTEQLERPTARQILVRNLVKILELEPNLQVWPFMLVMFMTRNRQRLGDMLARTIVVRPGTPLQELESPRRSEHQETAGSQARDSKD